MPNEGALRYNKCMKKRMHTQYVMRRRRSEDRMETITSFGEWLRRARKACDLTQAELAQQVGCAEGTIRNLEADTWRPSK